ncbi:MAG: response regulator [Syntrophotalea sp.]|uniref:response regulator n=1 Tax=Syntrophotalea sp. TaxID=2812029 RepID=UPI003D13D5AC
MPDILRILITRDLQAIFETDGDFSRQEGLALLVAEDGEQAWWELDLMRPNLVMMDINAKGMPGDEFCRRLHQDPKRRHIPVVLMVENRNPQELDRCLKARCADILFKPLNQHLLLASARRILGLKYRSYKRVPMCLAMQYSSSPSSMRDGLCVNLCSGGMFVETRHLLPVEQMLQIAFTLPGTTRRITCKANVNWVNEEHNPVNKNLPTGLGLQFLSLELSDLLSICRYIRRRSVPAEVGKPCRTKNRPRRNRRP